jgi:hypothetical protein
MHDSLQRTLRIFVAALLACALFAGALAAAQTPPNKPAKPEAEWQTWLVQVQYADRQDMAAEDAARIQGLETQIETAATPAEKRRLQRELDQAKKDADKDRGYIVYGWSTHADAAGKPVDQTRAMTGFLLPASAENTKALAEAGADGTLLAVARKDSAELFSVSGRRWFRAERAATIKGALQGVPGNFEPPPPPAQRDDAALKTIDTSLAFNHTKPRESGGELHRYTINIKCDQAPESAQTLHVWFAAYVTVDDPPQVVGPILEHVEVPRGPSGNLTISRSYEFITRAGVKLDAQATKVEPMAIAWK